MTIELKDYQNVIHTLVWKFRNLGFADALYAPVMAMGMEAKVTQHFDNMEKRSDKKQVSFTVKNFEDLLSEGYLIFTEVKNAFERGELKELSFEQVLVTRLESHFTDLYKAVVTQKRKANVRHINDDDTETLSIEDTALWAIIRKKYNSLNDVQKMLYHAFMNKEIEPDKSGRITKGSVERYLRAKGISCKEILDVFGWNLV